MIFSSEIETMNKIRFAVGLVVGQSKKNKLGAFFAIIL